MQILTVTEARKDLYHLIDQTAESHQPIFIKGRRAEAVLISKEDWSSLQERLYLDSITGMRESIAVGIRTPLSECIPLEKVDW